MKPETEKIKLSLLRKNPANPRTIRDVKFAQLCENLRKYPKFLEKHSIVIKSWSDPEILGGNQRFEGLKAIGYKEVPAAWIKTADDFTDEEMKAFVVLDNLSFGEWDFTQLANTFEYDELQALGLDIPDFSALAQIDMDDFFAKDEGLAHALAEKFTIVLEYSPEEGARVKEALSKINPSAERAVWELLELPCSTR